jgi:hypothetical protein
MLNDSDVHVFGTLSVQHCAFMLIFLRPEAPERFDVSKLLRAAKQKYKCLGKHIVGRLDRKRNRKPVVFRRSMRSMRSMRWQGFFRNAFQHQGAHMERTALYTT